MANPENVEKFGEFLHYVAKNYGTPANFMKEVRNGNVARYNDGYRNGEKDGTVKGIVFTSSAVLVLYIFANAPKLVGICNEHYKRVVEPIDCRANSDNDAIEVVDKAYIEKLLHLDKYAEEVIKDMNFVKKYKVNGRVIHLIMSDEETNDEYEASIVFKNNGRYRLATCKENDLALKSIADGIKRLLEGKSYYYFKE